MFKIIRVRGISMAPRYRSGAYLLLLTRLRWLWLRPGRDIVFRDPGHGLLLKRVLHVDNRRRVCCTRGLYRESTAPKAKFADIIGTVLARA